jgi:hypothetical protein
MTTGTLELVAGSCGEIIARGSRNRIFGIMTFLDFAA